MQYIQARRLDNKLGMKDNLPLAIDKVIFLQSGGILLDLNTCNGERIYLSYSNLDWFRDDFNVVNSINKLEKYRELTEEDGEEPFVGKRDDGGVVLKYF